MEEKKINTRIVFSVVAVLLLIAVVAGATYAYFSATASSEAQTVTTATMDLAFDDSTAIINATNITPMYQSEIETKATKKSFTVTNNGTQSMYLQMNLTDITIDTALKNVWFRWALYEEGTRIGIGTFYEAGTEVFMQQNMVIEPGTDNAKDYDLYIWIEESDEEQNTMQGKTFSGKITVNGSMTEYEDAIITVTGYDYMEGTPIVTTTTFGTSDTSVTISYGWLEKAKTSGDEKLTNVRNLSITNAGGVVVIFPGDMTRWPISTESLTIKSDYNGTGNFKHLTNLKSVNFDYTNYCYYNITFKFPSSMENISGFNCPSSTDDGYAPANNTETQDFSNLVNLKTVSDNAFGHLTSEDTVILPASIKDTVSIGTGAFGSATIKYQ